MSEELERRKKEPRKKEEERSESIRIKPNDPYAGGTHSDDDHVSPVCRECGEAEAESDGLCDRCHCEAKEDQEDRSRMYKESALSERGRHSGK